MGLFGRKQTPPPPPRRVVPHRIHPSGWKDSRKPLTLTKDQLERRRLEDCADRCGLDLEENEDLLRYIDRHIREGGNFVIKKLVNKRAIKTLSSAERTDFPTREMVEEWVSRGDGFGPGTYVVLPAGKNRILARYEVQEW
jgi:hypothetical protein